MGEKKRLREQSYAYDQGHIAGLSEAAVLMASRAKREWDAGNDLEADCYYEGGLAIQSRITALSQKEK